MERERNSTYQPDLVRLDLGSTLLEALCVEFHPAGQLNLSVDPFLSISTLPSSMISLSHLGADKDAIDDVLAACHTLPSFLTPGDDAIARVGRLHRSDLEAQTLFVVDEAFVGVLLVDLGRVRELVESLDKRGDGRWHILVAGLGWVAGWRQLVVLVVVRPPSSSKCAVQW
ncbi:hypothetical protein L1887_56530 [Cichorium endivia]|nr:hypothetical protein L1887_56530 [Cichorium endivia]